MEVCIFHDLHDRLKVYDIAVNGRARYLKRDAVHVRVLGYLLPAEEKGFFRNVAKCLHENRLSRD
jgi:hypothetical protein